MPRTIKPGKVAAYLSRHIDASEKPQYQIAQEAGFDRPNIISMIKTGLTKMPMNRIILMSKAIDCDPVELYRLCMDEYMPELLAVGDEVYKRDKLNESEQKVVARMRLATKGRNFKFNSNLTGALDDFVNQLPH